ncbi:MAG: tetratricopeptide repeat protein [Candidatus Babeliales bacterium]
MKKLILFLICFSIYSAYGMQGKPDSPRANLQKGISAYDQNNKVLAISFFEKAFESTDPIMKQVAAHYLAGAYASLNNVEQSKKYKSIELQLRNEENRKNAAAAEERLQQALFYLEQQNIEKAIELLKDLYHGHRFQIPYPPIFFAATFLLGRAYLKLGEIEIARGYLTRATSKSAPADIKLAAQKELDRLDAAQALQSLNIGKQTQ